MSEYAIAKILTATEAFPACLIYGVILITGSGSYEYLECHVTDSSLCSVTIDTVEVFDQSSCLENSDYVL